MQDTSLPNAQTSVPTHVDDYQPPQQSDTLQSQPFNVPAPPPVSSTPQSNQSVPSGSVNRSSGVKQNDNPNPPDEMTELDKLILKEYEASKKTQTKENSVMNDIPSDQTQDDTVDTTSSQEVGTVPSENQSLETQNIFDLLGVSQSKPEEKEAFLDELQEVIWEDFIENDVELLLSKEQVAQLREIQAKGQTREVQEEMLVYLEKLLPDLEDIMMDKALELKEDMVLERISGMKEFFSGNQAALDQITRAEEQISDNKWADAGKTLNSIK